ncbi:MAG: hypothetical protein ACLQJR_29880 [Stellaceae bacterium]
MATASKPKARRNSSRKSAIARRVRVRARKTSTLLKLVKTTGMKGPQLQRLIFALRELADEGSATGVRSRKLSVRVDPGIMDAAARHLGLTNPSDVVNASLALAAAPDRFKIWLRESEDTLPDDFELAI